MVGPFIKFGAETSKRLWRPDAIIWIRPASRTGCWRPRPNGVNKFADKGLLLSPGVAQMYTTGEIAAQLCLENGGLRHAGHPDARGAAIPTTASTQTIFTILKAKWYYLEQKQYKEWPLTQTFEVNVPGQHATSLALPWGGTSHPVWFKDDPRVANVKVAAGVFAREVMEGVVATVKMYEKDIKPLPLAQQEIELGKIAASIQSNMPPRENPQGEQIGRFGLRVGTSRPRPLRHPRSQQLQADRFAAGLRRLLVVAKGAAQAGFASGCQAFGHRELLGILRAFGLVMEPNLTVHK